MNNEQDNEISRFFLDEVTRLSKELKNMNTIQTEETNFLKKQINLLNQDRIKLTQNILILDNRVAENEKFQKVFLNKRLRVLKLQLHSWRFNILFAFFAFCS